MRHYFNFGFLLLCFLVLSNTAGAQEVKVNAKLDKSTIALGDQTILRLSVEGAEKSVVRFPLLSDTLSSKIQIVEIGKIDTLRDQNDPSRYTISRQYTITSFDPGLQMIPELSFESKDGSLKTDALPLQVNSVTVDTTKAIYDIKQPLAVSYTFMDWLRDNWHWLVIGSVVVLFIIGLVYYFKKRKKTEPVITKPKVVVPPHIIAFEKLNALKEQKLWQQDQVKQYHSELTDIIRVFLEKRFKISAQEQTSEEILSGLKDVELSEVNRNQLRQMLLLADLVKFAKAHPLATDNEQSMENALQFVMDTRDTDQSTENKVNNELV